MKIQELIKDLQKLNKKYGDLDVFYIHSSSGDVGYVWSARMKDTVSEEYGPFDLEDGKKYISLTIGGN